MYLVYLDESGNTGENFDDAAQPIFCLCAMAVAEEKWQSLEAELEAIIKDRFPDWRDIDGFEIHAADLRGGRGVFDGMEVKDRVSFRDSWMDVGAKHGVRLLYRSVNKKSFSTWLVREFGHGITLNPYLVAFVMLSKGIDNYLKSLPGPPLAILVCDENKEIVADVEKSLSRLRVLDGELRLDRILEKGFFIDSSKSLPLQLCDLYAMSIRKMIERKAGRPPKAIDDSGIVKCEELLYDEHIHDLSVLDWFTTQHKAGAKKVAARV